ncbi:unnamed protein product [Cladocopium goreaui]|uniref:Pentatricopeptide repeat-containing protein n=1 Tax=Cladocopium goreaui TaxID=2562237 RepID=A0A9P1BS67_9DINO|nr:unnamed protein product [Cladocopium goreaui]|mmetsp:Transcript_9055/g.20147  ORF Transcript_9055/g.20147 Transcript_9055/m.20147 type:complete len:1041 (+) Transcript_9055:135-3257(+)
MAHVLTISGDMFPHWTEIVFTVFFLLGFLLLRTGRLGKFGAVKSKKINYPIAQKPFPDFSEKLRTKIEEEATAENWLNVLKAWRKEHDDALTPKDVLRPVARAFLEVDPDALAKEIASHLKRHWQPQWHWKAVALPVLDVLARAGETSLMEEFWQKLPHEKGAKYSHRLYDVLIGGFASAGQVDKVKHYEGVIRRQRLRLSARGFSLVIKGYLKNRFVDEVFEKLLEMRKSGYEIPSFAMAQFFRVSSEAGRSEEFVDDAMENLEMSIEAYMVLLDEGGRAGNLAFVEKVEKSVRTAYTAVPPPLAEEFIKFYMTRCQEKAIAMFKAGQRYEWSEMFVVRLLARCAKNKFLIFAEEIMMYAQKSNAMTLSIYSALMKVYAFSGLYERACDLYEDIQKDGIEPDSIMYGCLMKFAMECGRTSLLNDLAAKVSQLSQLDIQHYMTMIRAAGSEHRVDRAFAIFEQLKKTISPDIAAYNSLLDVCCRAGDMTKAKELTEEMRQIGMVDSITYNTLFKGLLDVGDMKAARRLQQEMTEAGVPPNDVSHNCLINAAVKAGNLSEAWELVHAMESHGIAPDRYTVSTMMKTLRKDTPPGHAQKCFDLLGRSGVELCQDEILLNIVLETSARNKDFKRIEWTLECFETSKMSPSTPTYGSLIKAYGMLKRPKKCWQMWKEMTELRGLKPTDIVIGCMLDALVCNSLVDDAEQIFAEQSYPPNVILYSIIFKGLSCSHRPKRAMDLWRNMRKQGLKMSTVGYNSILDSQARQGNMEEMFEILEAMDEEAIEPDSVTHSIIVKTYCVRGDFQNAMQAIRNMQDSKVEHDAVVYNTCLDACSKKGKLDLVETLIKDMIQHNVPPTNFTLGIVVKAYGRAKQLEKAFQMVEALPKIGKFKPNGQVWFSLMLSCINNGAPKEAVAVFYEMQELGHEVDGKAYQVLISGLVKTGSLREAVALVDEAYGLRHPKRKCSSLKLDSECMEALFAAIFRGDLRLELGLPLLERLRAAQLPVSSKSLRVRSQIIEMSRCDNGPRLNHTDMYRFCLAAL